jgi:hypothetical protein
MLAIDEKTITYAALDRMAQQKQDPSQILQKAAH